MRRLIIFGQAFNLLDQEAIATITPIYSNSFTKESGADLLFAAQSLYSIVREDSLHWAERAKIIALHSADSETFLGAVDFLDEIVEEKDLLHLLEQSLKTLMEQEEKRTACRFVLPECKKCLALLKRFPEEEGKRLEEIIFKR